MALPIDCTVFLEPVLSYGILHSDASHCPDSCINMVLTCATPSVGRTICAMERPCFGSTLRTASIIAVKSAYLRESFPFSPMAAVAFFSAGSSSPCAAARAFASSLICSLWVSHIYLLPAFFRFRVLAPVPRKGGIARRDHEFLVRPRAVFVAVGVVRPVHRIASVNGAIRSKSS